MSATINMGRGRMPFESGSRGILSRWLLLSVILAVSVNRCPAEEAPLTWTTVDGQSITGSLSVAAKRVYIFDWNTGTQHTIPRSTLPKPNGELADAVEADLQFMTKPIKDNQDAVKGTGTGTYPYFLRETTTYTLALGNQTICQHYHRNGKLCRVELGDQNGTKDGPQLWLYPSGEICQIDMWRNGVMQGLSAKFYKNGSWLVAGMWVDGKKNGKEYFFHSNGNVAVRWNVHMNKFTGQSQHYNVEGELFGVQTWNEGVASSMRVLIEPRDQAEFQAITAASDLVGKIAKFGEMWDQTK